jgi:hypothetical protein
MCFPAYHSLEGSSRCSCRSTVHLQGHHSLVADGVNSSNSTDHLYTLEVIETCCAANSL